jgi:formylglycine-generating enzyme required for sulfatase activity
VGWNQSEVAEAAAHCQAVHADCTLKHAERALGSRMVTVPAFLMDRNEVTNHDFAEWLNLMRGWLHIEPLNDSIFVKKDGVVLIDLHPHYSGIEEIAGRFVARAGRERQPVGKVTWDGALGYCQDNGSRLPTEAEWELAAGGIERRRYPWGNDEPSCTGVRVGRNSRQPCYGYPKEVADVGTSAQDVTPEGIHDLGGNLAEWVMDAFVAPYPLCAPPCQAPRVMDGGVSGVSPIRVVRGASFYNFPVWARSAMRSKWPEASRPQADFGFRCAKSVNQ